MPAMKTIGKMKEMLKLRVMMQGGCWEQTVAVVRTQWVVKWG